MNIPSILFAFYQVNKPIVKVPLPSFAFNVSKAANATKGVSQVQQYRVTIETKLYIVLLGFDLIWCNSQAQHLQYC